MKYSSKSIYKTFLVIFNVLLFVIIVLVAVELNKSPIEMAKENSQPKSASVKVKEEGKAKGFVNAKSKTPNSFAFKASISASKYYSFYTYGSSGVKSPKNFKNLGWIPFWDQEKAFSSFQKNSGVFSHISLFWYILREDGSVKKYIYAVEDRNIISYAHSKNVKVLALIANLPDEDEGGDWDYSRVDKVIETSAARKKHVADLVALSKKNGFDGVNIDYEAMREYQKDSFTLFIKDLSTALHNNGKILAVALHPKKSEGDPQYSNGSQAQDWKELAKYADQLHLMTYGEHWDTSSPGPIASVPWVKSILSYANSLIPRQKLFAGVPMYGYDWSNTSKARGLTYSDVKNLISKYKPKVLLDSRSQSKHFGYRDSAGVNHTVWFEDKDTIQAKMNLFNNLGISNTAFWRLGSEDTRVWSILR